MMNEYNSLLTRIAEEYKITRRPVEDEKSYEARVLYSLMGSSGLASLLDTVETDEGDVSVVHIKNRMKELAAVLSDLYSDFHSGNEEAEELVENIYGLLQANGFFYHAPYRLMPCEDREVKYGGICFARRIFTEGYDVSGLGRYSCLEGKEGTAEDVCRLFHIDPLPCRTFAENLIRKAVWTKQANDTDAEYLRILPPFTVGYWQREADRSGRISLLRLGQPGSRLYYFYKTEGPDIYVSRLPEWLSQGQTYRKVSNGLLSMYGTLPPVREELDGEYATISFDYLPAEDICRFIKLYSWSGLKHKDTDFIRVMPQRLWGAFRTLLTELGYRIGD